MILKKIKIRNLSLSVFFLLLNFILALSSHAQTNVKQTNISNFDKNFKGLTGEIDQIYKFSTQVNAPFFPVVNSPEQNYTVDHSGSLVLISPEAKYAGFFRAPHDTDKITKALASLLN